MAKCGKLLRLVLLFNHLVPSVISSQSWNQNHRFLFCHQGGLSKFRENIKNVYGCIQCILGNDTGLWMHSAWHKLVLMAGTIIRQNTTTLTEHNIIIHNASDMYICIHFFNRGLHNFRNRKKSPEIFEAAILPSQVQLLFSCIPFLLNNL